MKFKNLKTSKKLVSLLLASSIALTTSGCGLKNIMLPNKMANGESVSMYLDDSLTSDSIASIPENGIENVFEYNEAWDLVVYKGSVGFVYHSHKEDIDHNQDTTISELSGSATTTARLNFRVGPSTKYQSIRVLDKNCTSEVIGITNNNWYIIKNNNEIGYVSGNYVTFKPNTYTNEELQSPSTGTIYTTNRVNFREGPGTNSKVLTTLNKGTQLDNLEYIDNYWYKVRYNNKIGYVYGKYISFEPIKSISNNTPTYPSGSTTPTTPIIKDEDLTASKDGILKVIYATSKTELRSTPSNTSESLYTIDQNEVCQVIGFNDEWYEVKCANKTGYIPKSLTCDLTDVFVVVDISAQKLTLYNNNIILLETDVTTGKEGTHDTPCGIFSIKSKTKDTYLRGKDYCSHVDYWMPFYYGYGLHDADWRSVFGSDYYKTSGSHGCVNIPPEVTDDIYDAVKVGTKVLVHK